MADEEDVPPENSTNLPALRPQGTQLVVVRPGSGLVSRIAGDACRHLPNQTEKLWQVGDYEVNEQSYRQIMIWLEQIRKAGKEITLSEFLYKQETKPWGTPVEWIIDGKIRHVQLDGYSLEQIDLSNVPYLTDLWCHNNKITYIDMSKIPMLNYLKCCDNMLSAIDLSHVGKLERLICCNNKLQSLNLNFTPLLFDLICENNILREMDLSACLNLDYVNANGNSITHIDLSKLNKLFGICLNNNELSSITFPSYSNLDSIELLHNPIKKLDLSNNKKLTFLRCENVEIIGIDASIINDILH
jgi:hypothetical protein